MNSDIVESFAQMVREKGVDKDVLAGIIEEIFGMLVRKKFGEEAKYDVVVNMDRGDIEIFLEREKKLKLEVERLGKTPEEIQRDVERQRQEGLRRPQQLPPSSEGPAR